MIIRRTVSHKASTLSISKMVMSLLVEILAWDKRLERLQDAYTYVQTLLVTFLI